MKLYLARHGETLFNQLHLSQGWCDSPLTEFGIRQGNRLGELLSNVQFADIYSSTSERAVDTADLVNKHNSHPVNEIIETKLLKEANFGMLEAMTDPLRFALLRTDINNHSFLAELKQGYKAYNGDSFEDIQNRVNSMLKIFETKYKDDDCVLFMAHGGVLRVFLYTLLNDGKDELINVIPNAGCVVIEYTNNKYRYLETIENDVSRETK